MELPQFFDGYDIDARSRYGEYDDPIRAEIEATAQELEEKACRFGFFVGEVVDLAEATSHVVSVDEKINFIGQTTVDRYQGYLEEAHRYYRWYDQNFLGIEKRAVELMTDQVYGDHARSAFVHLPWHALNWAAENQWQAFIINASVGLTPREGSQKEMHSNMDYLAYQGLRQIQQRELMLNRAGLTRTQYLKGETGSIEPSFIEGWLNEIDCGLALLKVSSQDPNGGFWVLPAPPQFESLAGSDNVDFLVIDTKGQRAVGVQVKSSGVLEGEMDDNPKVVMISGRHDLGNSFALPDEERGIGFKDYSYAGNISQAWVAQSARNSDLIRSLERNQRLKWALGKARIYGRPKLLQDAVEKVTYHLEAKL